MTNGRRGSRAWMCWLLLAVALAACAATIVLIGALSGAAGGTRRDSPHKLASSAGAAAASRLTRAALRTRPAALVRRAPTRDGRASPGSATPFGYGLPAHVVPPRWAVGRHVHFFGAMASAAAISSAARASSPAGAEATASSPRRPPAPSPAAQPTPGPTAGPLIARAVHPADGTSAAGAQSAAAGDQPPEEGDLGRRCGGCLGVPVRYYGGPVQHEPEVHVIFWGKNWNQAGGPGPHLREEVMRFYEGLASSPSGTAFQGILTQYFDETGRVAPSLEKRKLTSFTDESVPAPREVTDDVLQHEARTIAENANNRWVLGPNAQFVVIPAPGATYQSEFDHSFCAYHSVVEEPANYWTYTFLSYNGEEPFERGCLSYDSDEAASHTEKAGHVLSMDASHEYAESVTDPAFTAWLDEEGNELADICSSGDDQLANKSWVQGMWDDHQSTCALEDSQPPHVLGLTEPASSVGMHEATLNATVNAENEGLQTKYRFEYGPTTSYGETAPAQGFVGVGNRPGNQQLAQAISGLQGEATYHYRVVATDSREGREATTYGEDHTLVTSPWAIGASPPTLGAGQSSFGSAMLACSFRPWSCGGASCPSRASCVAVGTYELGNRELPMAQVWSGGQWSIQALPFPAQTGEQVALTGVSCAAAGVCLSVGYEQNAAGVHVPVSDRLNGTEGWSVSPISPPAADREAGLEGVSCSSASECMAVGLAVNGSGAELPYAALWRNGGWSIEPVKPVAAANAVLEGVSCSSARSCVAVGFSETGAGVRSALTEMWNGAAWSPASPQAPAQAGSFMLSGVSCASPEACTAVGTYTAAKGQAALLERWDGAKWSVQPAVDTGHQEELFGVSCPGAQECTAVGDYEAGERWVALVLTWNGSSWSTQASDVDETQASELHAVSCAAASTCAAVGLTGWSAAGRSHSGSVQALTEIRSGEPNPPAGAPASPAQQQSASGVTGVTARSARSGLGTGGVVSRLAPALRCRVPRLTGDSVRRARVLLGRAHCALGRVRRFGRFSERLVIRFQSHSAGARLKANTRINVALVTPERVPSARR
jgi:hypothetical protein